MLVPTLQQRGTLWDRRIVPVPPGRDCAGAALAALSSQPVRLPVVRVARQAAARKLGRALATVRSSGLGGRAQTEVELWDGVQRHRSGRHRAASRHRGADQHQETRRLALHLVGRRTAITASIVSTLADGGAEKQKARVRRARGIEAILQGVHLEAEPGIEPR